MSLVGFVPSVINSFGRFLGVAAKSPLASGVWSLTPIRTNIRVHFPRPNERMRIKKHGYWARMATPGGRRVLMRRILKGRHVLSH